MSFIDEVQIDAEIAETLPSAEEIVGYILGCGRPQVVEVLRAADRQGHPAIQPRCGVGGHAEMTALLRVLDRAGADILTITIDSYTRLKQFRTSRHLLRTGPSHLNGYPLVAHGWQRGRELGQAVAAPLEVRHGSPDARDLFAVAIASGITSFEGGGISYNLPYSKDVPLSRSLEAWQQVDASCGELAPSGVIVDRELFGTLTAVLVPPSISLAITMLEAIAAAEEGVRCISIAYPQGGEAHQDIAALRSIRSLARRYLPDSVEVYPVLHEFMGVFPSRPERADALILYGGLIAKLGGATKVINKTNQEAHGIPDPEANAHGLRTTALGTSELLDFLRLDEDRVSEEAFWIEQEVAELVDPVLQSGRLNTGIEAAFRDGRLDIPFSASIHARSELIPRRDGSGAIRYHDPGLLPFSGRTRGFHQRRLSSVSASRSVIENVTADINYFLKGEPAS